MLQVSTQTMWPTDFLMWVYQSPREPLKIRLYYTTLKKKLHVGEKRWEKAEMGPNRWISGFSHWSTMPAP